MMSQAALLRRKAAALARIQASEAELARRELVRRSGLSGEVRIAWEYLYYDVGEGKPALLFVSPAEVGADQRRGDRSGRRWLEALAKAGLVTIKRKTPARNEACRTSAWELETHDPLATASLLSAGECEGQAELFERGEDPEILAIGAPSGAEGRELSGGYGAISAAHLDLGPNRRLLKTSDLRRGPDQRSKSSGAQGSGGCGATSAAQTAAGDGTAPDCATPVGEAWAAGLRKRLPTPVDQLEEIRRLSGWLYREVGDAKLFRDTCDELAAAIVEGRWALEHVRRVLNAVERAYNGQTKTGVPKVPRCVYFTRAAQASIRENDPRRM